MLHYALWIAYLAVLRFLRELGVDCKRGSSERGLGCSVSFHWAPINFTGFGIINMFSSYVSNPAIRKASTKKKLWAFPLAVGPLRGRLISLCLRVDSLFSKTILSVIKLASRPTSY